MELGMAPINEHPSWPPCREATVCLIRQDDGESIRITRWQERDFKWPSRRARPACTAWMIRMYAEFVLLHVAARLYRVLIAGTCC